MKTYLPKGLAALSILLNMTPALPAAAQEPDAKAMHQQVARFERACLDPKRLAQRATRVLKQTGHLVVLSTRTKFSERPKKGKDLGFVIVPRIPDASKRAASNVTSKTKFLKCIIIGNRGGAK